MTKPKLLIFLLIICGNSLPFLWHKSFWKSMRDVCLAYCAISIGSEKCFWGECVDPLTKKCAPFFQRIQSQPLNKMGQGGYHEIHAIGSTNLVSKSLYTNGGGDNRFVTEIVHRLPIEYGINRPICVLEGENYQYRVISQRVIPLESHYFNGERMYRKTPLFRILHEYRYTVHHVFTVLAEWVRKNSGLAVNDFKATTDHESLEYGGPTVICHNIALTLTGEPTFFDLDLGVGGNQITFDRRATSLPWLTQEIVENAREELQTAMANPEWKAFTKEVLQIVNFKLKTPSSKCIYD